MRDPQAMSGTQVYPPPMPPCAREGCGDSFGAHGIDKKAPHGRGRCTRWGHRDRCECPEYMAVADE